MSEFKAADKVRLEGVVTGDIVYNNGTGVRMREDDTAWNDITQDAMAHATLIPTAPKPRYDWSNIPPEYGWAATDKSGTVYAYKNKPVCHPDVNHEYWYDKEGEAKYLRAGPITKNWRDSLEQRPGATHITPCKGTNCGSTNGVHSPECQAEHIAAITGVPMENKVLDLSKPVRRKNSEMEVRVIGTMSDGRIVCEYPLFGDPQYAAYYDRELENIPTPKKTTSDVLSLWEFKTGARAFLWGDAAGCATRLSRVRVSYTEGEGWSIEGVK